MWEEKEMYVHLNLIKLVILIVIIISYTNYIEAKDATVSSTNLLQVYKGAQCGCCNSWISHMKENGGDSVIHSS